MTRAVDAAWEPAPIPIRIFVSDRAVFSRRLFLKVWHGDFLSEPQTILAPPAGDDLDGIDGYYFPSYPLKRELPRLSLIGGYLQFVPQQGGGVVEGGRDGLDRLGAPPVPEGEEGAHALEHRKRAVEKLRPQGGDGRKGAAQPLGRSGVHGSVARGLARGSEAGAVLHGGLRGAGGFKPFG